MFDKLLLTVQCGTGLVSDGERCYDIVRYEAVVCAVIGLWSALCWNVVVVRVGATQLIDFYSCCDPHSGMAFFLFNMVGAVSWVRYSWAWAWCCSFGLFLCFACSFFRRRYRWGWNLLLLDMNLPILWLISSSFLERADKVLDRVDPMVRLRSLLRLDLL